MIFICNIKKNVVYLCHNFKTMENLVRSRNGKIGGVCAGIAQSISFDNFKADPTLIRVLWAIGTLCSVGLGILVYLICWIIIPLEPKTDI